MARVLQRHLGPTRTMDPGQWTHAGLRVFARCPACGGVFEVTDTIDRAGRVAHRQPCPFETCAFVDWLVLEAYQPVFDTSDVPP